MLAKIYVNVGAFNKTVLLNTKLIKCIEVMSCLLAASLSAQLPLVLLCLFIHVSTIIFTHFSLFLYHSWPYFVSLSNLNSSFLSFVSVSQFSPLTAMQYISFFPFISIIWTKVLNVSTRCVFLSCVFYQQHRCRSLCPLCLCSQLIRG